MSFCRFVTMHAFDGQTDRLTDRILIARPRLHSVQRGKNENENEKVVSFYDQKLWRPCQTSAHSAEIGYAGPDKIIMGLVSQNQSAPSLIQDGSRRTIKTMGVDLGGRGDKSPRT